jgi:hypothetical protein
MAASLHLSSEPKLTSQGHILMHRAFGAAAASEPPDVLVWPPPSSASLDNPALQLLLKAEEDKQQQKQLSERLLSSSTAQSAGRNGASHPALDIEQSSAAAYQATAKALRARGQRRPPTNQHVLSCLRVRPSDQDGHPPSCISSLWLSNGLQGVLKYCHGAAGGVASADVPARAADSRKESHAYREAVASN